jgi:hypothetical protein
MKDGVLLLRYVQHTQEAVVVGLYMCLTISSRLLKTLRPDAVKKINMEKTPFKQMASDSVDTGN